MTRKKSAYGVGACVAWRSLDREDNDSPNLFVPTRHANSDIRWGWASSWKDAMLAWIKLAKRDADAYDFAAHANPATTHRHFDRRRIKRATAVE